jgi:hypothetical protein
MSNGGMHDIISCITLPPQIVFCVLYSVGLTTGAAAVVAGATGASAASSSAIQFSNSLILVVIIIVNFSIVIYIQTYLIYLSRVT